MENLISYPGHLLESSEKGTLYSDDNPNKTVQGMHYGTGKESEESIKKLESLFKDKRIPHRNVVSIANTMHNRAKHHGSPNVGIRAGEKVWKEYLEKLKERTQEINDSKKKSKNEGMILSFGEFLLEKKGPCWPGYKQVGLKKKNGKMVPNCVPG